MSAEGERKYFRISQAKEQRRHVKSPFTCMCFFGVAAIFAAFFLFLERGFVWKILRKSYWV